MGYKNDEGHFYLVGRKKEMIRRGGMNIFPREIERVLYNHPKIQENAVIGVPDPKYGEEVKAFIIPKESELLDEEEVAGAIWETVKGRFADLDAGDHG